jgi:AcrR family transcriptional regulator
MNHRGKDPASTKQSVFVGRGYQGHGPTEVWSVGPRMGLCCGSNKQSFFPCQNAPYRHFASRQDLLANLAADGFREFADDMEGAVRAMDPNTFPTPLSYSRECLRAIFRVYLRFARKRHACYRLMFSELGYSLHSEHCRSNSMRAFGVLTDTVGRAHHNGWRNHEDPKGLSLQIWATVHGWASIINDRLLPEDLSEAVDYPLGSFNIAKSTPGRGGFTSLLGFGFLTPLNISTPAIYQIHDL